MGVARDAVAADAGPRVEGHEAVRLGRRGVDDLHDVQLEHARDLRQLVGERDVDRPEGVLHQLGHLGSAGRRHLVHGVRVPGERSGGLVRTAPGGPAHDAGHGLVAVPVVARVDALGAEGHCDVLAGNQTALGQRADQEVGGAADVRRRGQDQRLAGYGVLDDRRAGATQDREVGDQVLVDRRGHADDDGPGLLQAGGVDGEVEAAGRGLQGGAQPVVVGREQIHVSGLDIREPGGARIDPEHPPAGGMEGERGGQADVAEADDPDVVPEAGHRGHRVRRCGRSRFGRRLQRRVSERRSGRGHRFSSEVGIRRSGEHGAGEAAADHRSDRPGMHASSAVEVGPAHSGGRRKEKNTSRTTVIHIT